MRSSFAWCLVYSLITGFDSLIGLLLGAIVGELIMGEQLKQALHSGIGSFLGFLGGVAAKMLIAGIMVAWFVWRTAERGLPMNQLPRLNKTVLFVAPLDDLEEEKKYWQLVAAQGRLAAVELNRIMVYGHDKVSSRLQRLLATSQLK